LGNALPGTLKELLTYRRITVQKWEYKVVGHTLAEEELNRLGREGWELVVVAGAGSVNCTMFFKRPVS
jgi:hypothetical protein